MADDDPFADNGSEPEDVERTIILPAPGGRRRAPGDSLLTPKQAAPTAAAAPAAMPTSMSGPAIAIDSASKNPLVKAGSGIFALVRRLAGTINHDDVAGLRDSVVASLQAFESRARNDGASPEAAHAARYALCALIDETVLGTPWGSQGAWGEHTVLGTLHNETYGGERFFQIVTRMAESAARNLDLLEFLYICLSLGFKGKYAIMDRGSTELDQVTHNLYRTIAGQRGEPERELSPHWQGVTDSRPKVGRYIPLWVVPVAVCAVATLAYLGFSYWLNSSSDGTFDNINALARDPPEVRRAAPVATYVPKPVAIPRADPARPRPYDRIRGLLEDEVRRNLVAVGDLGNAVKITVHNKGLFRSGRANVDGKFRPLIQKIGAAIDEYPGPFLVTGHTDSQPIRTLRFPSNWHLSSARAKAIAAALGDSMGGRSKLQAEGRADTEPLASNKEKLGREQNRRVEIRVPVK